jgi:hypothetical protein
VRATGEAKNQDPLLKAAARSLALWRIHAIAE